MKQTKLIEQTNLIRPIKACLSELTNLLSPEPDNRVERNQIVLSNSL